MGEGQGAKTPLEQSLARFCNDAMRHELRVINRVFLNVKGMLCNQW